MLHFSKAKDNEDFFKCLEEKHPDRFTDWKITIVFYCAYHLVKALAEKKGVQIGKDHHEIHGNIKNPCNTRGTMQISRWAWQSYHALYNYSKDARYKVIDSYEGQVEDEKKDLTDALYHLGKIKEYIKSQGMEVE